MALIVVLIAQVFDPYRFIFSVVLAVAVIGILTAAPARFRQTIDVIALTAAAVLLALAIESDKPNDIDLAYVLTGSVAGLIQMLAVAYVARKALR